MNYKDIINTNFKYVTQIFKHDKWGHMINNSETKPTTRANESLILSRMATAKIFILPSDKAAFLAASTDRCEPFDQYTLSLPFSSCLLMRDCSKPLICMTNTDDMVYSIHSLLIHEKNHANYDITVLALVEIKSNSIESINASDAGIKVELTNNREGYDYYFTLVHHEDVKRETSGKLFARLGSLLSEIHDKNMYVGSGGQLNLSYKDPVTNEKYNHKIKDIIFIRNKPVLTDNTSQNNLPHNIEWSYRFAVMGHWRRLPDSTKIGKDRSGDYIVPGATWVVDHIRGDENLPLIDKTRVVVE